MPDVATHLGQAQHNEDFVTRVDIAQDSDWAVTGLFYAALHYVDAHLAKIGNMHPGDHEERERMILAHPSTKAVRWNYRRLKDYSNDARYKAHKFTAGDVASLQSKDLAPIKAKLK